METTPCHLCGVTSPRIARTPTLFGVRPLCAYCRSLYQAARADAFTAFHQRHVRPSLNLVVQPREAA